MTNKNKINEYGQEELDRVVVDEEGKRVKIVLSDGTRILVDYENIHYID
ncbi:hypothetical protein U8V72_17665 [Priestia filamentosa]